MKSHKQQTRPQRRRGPRKPLTTPISNQTNLQGLQPIQPLATNAPAAAKQSIDSNHVGQSSDTSSALAAAKKRRPHWRIRHKTVSVSSQAAESKDSQATPSTTIQTIDPIAGNSVKNTTTSMPQPVPLVARPLVSKEHVLADREAKRIAKQAAKTKLPDTNNRNESAEKTDAKLTTNVNNTTTHTKGIVDKPTEIVQKPEVNREAVAISIGQQTNNVSNSKNDDATAELNRVAVLAEREAKKLAKLAAKNKNRTAAAKSELPPPSKITVIGQPAAETVVETIPTLPNNAPSNVPPSDKMKQMNLNDDSSAAKPAPSKAERRAKQEAQRAAKAAAQAAKAPPLVASAAKTAAAATAGTAVALKRSPTAGTTTATAQLPSAAALHRVKLFNHLYMDRSQRAPHEIANLMLHPAVLKLGTQFANRVVVGSNARCIAFLNTMKIVSCAKGADYCTI